MDQEKTKLHSLAIAEYERLKANNHPPAEVHFKGGMKECWECRLLNQLGHAAEEEAKLITQANHADPNMQPCEVCGEKHRNYECCSDCNYNTHICHFCGDNLGHTQVSFCYIVV